MCPNCLTYKQDNEFHGHHYCRACQSDSQASYVNLASRVDVTSFRRFFDHESVRGSRLTNFQRSSLVTLWALNLSVSQIQQMTGCDSRTITARINQYNQTGFVADQPRPGRPPVTDPAEDEAIVNLAVTQRFTTPQRIISDLELTVSRRTIRRRLNAVGLGGRIARIEHPFTEQNLRKRLEFSYEHETWTDDQWDRVIFGDESYIYLGVHGKIWVQRPADAAYLKEFMVQGQLAHPPKIGVFACFTSQ